MAAPAPIPACVSVAEFLRREPGDGLRWQLVVGVPRMVPVARVVHGAMLAEVGAVAGNHLHDLAGPGVAVMRPAIVPRVWASHNMRIAGLAVTCTRHDADEVAVREPVLVVEVLSPQADRETWVNV